MSKKAPPAVALVTSGQFLFNTFNTTGLKVVPMTQKDLEGRIPNQLKEMNTHKPIGAIEAFEIVPTNSDVSGAKCQLVVVFEEQDYKVDLSGVKVATGAPCVNIKLFDRIANLTTMDPQQIKISPIYVTRMNYRISKNEQTQEIMKNNVLNNVVSFRKLIDDPMIVSKTLT